MDGPQQHPASERTRVRRIPERGRYDRRSLYELIDAAPVGHVAFVVEEEPYAIPMTVARDGDSLLLHGSSASRLMRLLGRGAKVCVSILHLDGMVVARSAIDSSMNYRSAVIFGEARPVAEEGRKLRALRIISEHLLPGRWDEGREPTSQELKATAVAELSLEEASVKIRRGPPSDRDADLGTGRWAGEIPLKVVSLPEVPDPALEPGIAVPPSVQRFRDERVPLEASEEGRGER